jgi:hypothetical protein
LAFTGARPVLVALLHSVEGEREQLAAAQAAADEERTSRRRVPRSVGGRSY